MRTTILAASLVASTLGAALADQARAGQVEVVSAEATRIGVRGETGLWRLDVTLRHADAGWEHYADAWTVLDQDGAELGTRTLLHPHEDEQPFTRSLSGVEIPNGVTRVIIRGHDTVHGDGEATLELELALPRD